MHQFLNIYMHRTDKYIKHLAPHVGNRDEKPLLCFSPHTIKCMTDSILASGNDTCAANVEKTVFVLAKPSVSFHRLASYGL